MRHFNFIQYECLSQSLLIVKETNVGHRFKLLLCLDLCILDDWINFSFGWSIYTMSDRFDWNLLTKIYTFRCAKLHYVIYHLAWNNIPLF